MHQIGSFLQKFLGGSCPQNTLAGVHLQNPYFDMKTAIFYSKFLQNIHRKALIVTCF